MQPRPTTLYLFTLLVQHHFNYTDVSLPGLFQGGPFASDPTEVFPIVPFTAIVVVVVVADNQLMATFGQRRVEWKRGREGPSPAASSRNRSQVDSGLTAADRTTPEAAAAAKQDVLYFDTAFPLLLRGRPSVRFEF